MREFKYRNVQPKAVVLDDTPEPYDGPYEVTSNGTLPTAGKTMGSDLTITVQPNLAALSVTENGTYAPTAPVQGFSSVTVNVPVGGNTLKTLLDNTKSCYYLFYQYSGNIADLISYDDTSEVTDMGSMYRNCTEITSVPLLNTSKVKNMSYMFYFCSALTSIPLLNTSEVTNMNSMFRSCSSLTSIPALDASKATGFANAFDGCSALTEIKMTGMSVNLNISASTLFTREALVEIITNCASVGTTQTLTIGATNLAKLSQADIDAATAKGWTIS